MRKTLVRLMNEGADRHEAIHAVASVLVEFISNVAKGSSPQSDPQAPYYAALERLTVRSWRRDFGVPPTGRKSNRSRR
jgi:hypothetical protein